MGNEKIKILIIDDDVSLIKVIKFSLNQKGYDTETVNDAEKAWDIITAKHFDFFLVDLILPCMNGFDLVKKIKSLPEHHNTPVLIVTARSSAGDAETASEIGADGILIKPFYLEDLFDRIEEVLKIKGKNNSD